MGDLHFIPYQKKENYVKTVTYETFFLANDHSAELIFRPIHVHIHMQLLRTAISQKCYFIEVVFSSN